MANYAGRDHKPIAAVINAAHPLSRGLELAWLVNSGSNAPGPGPIIHDASGHQRHANARSANAPAITYGVDGHYLYMSGTSGNYVERTGDCPSLTFPFSFASVVYKIQSVTSAYYFIGDKDTTNDYIYLVYNGIDERFEFHHRNGDTPDSTGWARCEGFANPSDGWHMVVGQCFSDDLHLLYVDSIFENASGVSGTNNMSSFDRVALGALRDSTPAFGTLQLLSSFMIWNRSLTTAEMRQLTRDPYQMFRRRRDYHRIYLPLLLALGQATETDIAQPISSAKSRALGQATELDVAQSVSSAKNTAIGLATETDVAQSVSSAKSRTVGQTLETDVAQTINPSGSIVATVAQALETDVAQIIGSAKNTAIGLATETDVAQSIASPKSKTLGQAAELDVALAVGIFKSLSIGQAVEIDLAFIITPVGGSAPAQHEDSVEARAGILYASYEVRALAAERRASSAPEPSYGSRALNSDRRIATNIPERSVKKS